MATKWAAKRPKFKPMASDERRSSSPPPATGAAADPPTEDEVGVVPDSALIATSAAPAACDVVHEPQSIGVALCSSAEPRRRRDDGENSAMTTAASADLETLQIGKTTASNGKDAVAPDKTSKAALELHLARAQGRLWMLTLAVDEEEDEVEDNVGVDKCLLCWHPPLLAPVVQLPRQKPRTLLKKKADNSDDKGTNTATATVATQTEALETPAASTKARGKSGEPKMP